MGQWSSRSMVLYCGLLLAVTAFSVDITLPAFSLIATDLSAAYAHVQLVVPLFILATGIGQLFAGPFSDRFGRRKTVLIGLWVYCIGASICFVAPSIEMLLFGRMIQGLGASAGPVVGRAILKDMFTGRELARNMALATMIFAIGPIFAPLLGVGVMNLGLGTWRLVFLLILLFGAVLLIIGYLRLPETNAHLNPRATAPSVLLRNSAKVMRNTNSRVYVLMTGPIVAMMMVILVCLPRVFNEMFNISGTKFALLFAIHGVGIILGQMINRRMIATLGVGNAMIVGSLVLICTTLLMLALNTANFLGPYVLSFTMVLFATSYLIVVSNTASLAIDQHGDIAGFVSSLLGFLGQFVSSVIAMLLVPIISGNLTTFIYSLLALALFNGAVLFLHLKSVNN